MQRIAILSKNERYCEYIKQILKTHFSEKQQELHILSYESSDEFLFDWEDYYFPLVLLDITSIQLRLEPELLPILAGQEKQCEVMLISNNLDQVLYGYEIMALDYLVFPMPPEVLFQKVENALQLVNKKIKQKLYIVVKVKRQMMRLKCDDIIYCIMFSHYIDIVTKTGIYTIKKKIGDLEQELPRHLFVRTHRSYIANIREITSIEKNQITFECGSTIPIAKDKISKLKEVFYQYYSQFSTEV